MELNLKTTRGRPEKVLPVTLIGPLARTDIAQLSERRLTAVEDLKRITDRHHKLAQYLAQGYKNVEAARLTGYAPARVSMLKSCPAFKELLEYYRSEQQDSFRDTYDALASLSVDAVQRLHDRIEEDPEQFTVGQLVQVAQLALDRSGHGPSTTHNVNVNSLSAQLEAARKRAKDLAQQQVEDAEVVPALESYDNQIVPIELDDAQD